MIAQNGPERLLCASSLDWTARGKRLIRLIALGGVINLLSLLAVLLVYIVGNYAV